ncbi:conserved hypothetical protein [Leishmania braziliensis MHOM/BR/75/M2904]|uniref:Uncharacterized protein n=2 Tax=Leishmania braziliensis TaxID=5660 RepID=A4HFG2_LEIBR|nr:conserved hypothetical protein [Leishmania braziliensis MHOM/BR/75/M2904]KAI5684596.1 hypothetical protein MNV84_04891 [Leishmania braziliensis]CAJ2475082.1 unnamed protein product [Leishmania braziliensis]CAJ2475588.1 unnamed protein product [Leishmania braziliensis]CAM45323.1 conserved hypothetical protein [Leishmania braziliensis MHOM/BR/75/M2904]SYZ66968.1 hypothetical_protein [Leishmania braziliensis MHOM/BR/75/M2904]
MNVEVTGRCFFMGDDYYISLPIVNKAANRGEPLQLLCSEMIHWDDYRNDRSINDGKPRMQQLFASSYTEPLARTFVLGSDTYVTQVTGVSATQAGSSSQMFSAEMQHWDDYCETRGITTGSPSMASLFRPFESKIILAFDLNERKLTELEGKSVALISYGAKQQTYCSEMEHRDDYVREKTGKAPEPSMASLFA